MGEKVLKKVLKKAQSQPLCIQFFPHKLDTPSTDQMPPVLSPIFLEQYEFLNIQPPKCIISLRPLRPSVNEIRIFYSSYCISLAWSKASNNISDYLTLIFPTGGPTRGTTGGYHRGTTTCLVVQVICVGHMTGGPEGRKGRSQEA